MNVVLVVMSLWFMVGWRCGGGSDKSGFEVVRLRWWWYGADGVVCSGVAWCCGGGDVWLWGCVVVDGDVAVVMCGGEVGGSESF